MRWLLPILVACTPEPVDCGPDFLDCLAYCSALADQPFTLGADGLPADPVDGMTAFSCSTGDCECGPGGVYL